MCAKAQVNHLQEDDLLYIMVDPSLYTHYSAGKAYPSTSYPFSRDGDEVPDFTACINNNELAIAKITHAILLKTCNDIVSMNVVLIDTLFSLIPMAFTLLYKQEWMMDLNAVVHQCFDWFVNIYGCTSTEDCKTNRMAMAANWQPLMRFEVIT